jgi:hypothetical protein
VDSANVASASAQPLGSQNQEDRGKRAIPACFPDGPLISLPWEGWWHDDPFASSKGNLADSGSAA